MTRPPVAIGDIHGCLDLLRLTVDRFPEREFVLLGDYIDRGPDSRGVLALVRELVEAGRATALMGNHDVMMCDVLQDGANDALWRMNGAETTLESYGGDWTALLTDAHWMREHLLPHVTLGHTLFSHAMRPHPSDPQAHLWGRPQDTPPYPLPKGVTHSVHGHTPMQSCPLPVAFDDGTVAWFIDTGAFFTGTLCALDTETWTPHLIRRNA